MLPKRRELKSTSARNIAKIVEMKADECCGNTCKKCFGCYLFSGDVDQLNVETRKSCPPVKCAGGKSTQCAYGYQKKDGCEICRCDDPCNPSGKV
jgi:hypothetical protein